jgi:pyruvate dehydrogenase E1 component beta subunit
VVREGTDATLIAYGPMVKTCLDAATAAEEDGRSLEVVDLRSLSPLDLPDGARLGPAHPPGGRGARGAVLRRPGRRDRRPAVEELYYEMEAPVLRVTGFDTPYPPSRVEEEYLPDLDRVLHAVDRSLAF